MEERDLYIWAKGCEGARGGEEEGEEGREKIGISVRCPYVFSETYVKTTSLRIRVRQLRAKPTFGNLENLTHLTLLTHSLGSE